MRIVDWDRLMASAMEQKQLVAALRAGKVIIYPTDTVYGIGCNAESARAVARLRRLKGTDQPLSVIAPGKAWILEHCIADATWLDRLPGPYTLVLPKKQPMLRAAAPGDSLGVRLPDHPFTGFVAQAGVPFVTTSVNRHGAPHATRLADMDHDVSEFVDIIIDAGMLSGQPSRVVDLTGPEPCVLR